MSKKKEPQYNLKEKVKDIDGNPQLQGGEFRFAQFDKPVEVEFMAAGKKRKETFTGGAINSKVLTMRDLFSRALRGGQQQKRAASSVDTDRRSQLMFKCVADQVDLSSEDVADIIKCVRDLGDALYLMRVKQFFGDL